MANFIGFEPAEYQKKMKLLDDVIRLKAKNKDAAEVSQGFQMEAAQKAAAQAKPIRDELQRQNALMLSFRSNKDILEAKQQLTQAKQLKDAADVEAQTNPNDQGYAELAQAYGLQLAYADAKMKLLEAMRDSLKAKLQYEKQLKIKEVENRMDEYQDSMDNFMEADIPVGFIQVVDIRTLPQQPQVVPGAPQVPVNQPQPQIAQPKVKIGIIKKSKALRDIEEMYNTQIVPANLSIGPGANNIAFIAPTGSPGIVGLYNLDTGDEEYGNFDDDAGGFIFPKAPGLVISPKTMLEVIQSDYDNMSLDGIKALLALYFSLFPDIKPYTNIQVDVKDPNDPTKTIKVDQEIFDNMLSIIQTVEKNPNLDQAEKELKPLIGSGILGDLVKKAARTIARVVAPNMLQKKPKRGPPKLRLGPNGEYGNVRVDMPALLNRGRVRVMRGGAVVLDEVEENVNGFGLGRLITKRVMQKTIDAAPPKVRKQYERLNKLANAAEQITKKAGNAKGSGKISDASKITKTSAKKPQIIVVGDGADLAQRLKIAVGEYGAGNDSSENIQLITELAKKMMDLGKISSDRYRQIVESVA